MQAQQAIPERIIGIGAADDLAGPLDRHGFGKKLLMVCDEATWDALGKQLYYSPLGDRSMQRHSLGRRPKALMSYVPTIMDLAKDVDGLLAVGSGTVNDLTKYAASELKKPYIAVATAASMNGYTSAGVSLEEDGFKQSYIARPPQAVIADLDVIIKAPRRLMRSGLGDTLARSTIEADCLLSHLLLGTPYPKEAFDCLRTHEQYLLSKSTLITNADVDYARALLDALLDAGDWMARTGSSAVASQGEHMIAHTAEMMYGSEVRDIFHGELVAVTTIAMSHLQRKMLVGSVRVKALSFNKDRFDRLFGKKIGPILAPIYARKLLSPEQAESINRRLEHEWPEIKRELLSVMESPTTIERAFTHANLPMQPSHVGLNNDRFNSAMTYAHMTRDRFTFLDLSAMTGKRLASED